MRGINNAVILIAVMILPVTLLAQFSGWQASGFNPGMHELNNLGGGARALGMGGAYLGVSDGEMAYSWNPAGLMNIEKGQIGVQFASVADKFSYPRISWSSIYSYPNIAAASDNREHFSVNYAGFVAPFEWMDRNWAAGGGYRNVYDMIFESSSPGYNGSVNSFTQSRGVDAISMAAAGEIVTGISAGLTLNGYIRNSESQQDLGQLLAIISTDQTDTTIYDYRETNNSHYSGFNLDVGFHGDLGMISGGFVVHTPYNLKEENKITSLLVLPPQPVGTVDRYSVTYNMPLSYSLGIAVKPMEKLTVAFDFDSNPMSSVEAKYNYEQVAYNDTTFDLQLEDLNQFRIGAEYMLDAGFVDIPVRFGFRNQPSTSTELLAVAYDTLSGTWSETRGDQLSTNLISFGSGLHFEKIWFDIAYQFGSSSYDRTVTYLTPSVYEIKRDYSRLIISSGMFF